LAPQTFERIDAVLLSHDEHADNLDTLGRSLLARADIVLTTRSAAARLGDRSLGLVPWESRIIAEGKIRVSATPARHGPPGSEPLLGDVTGFVVESLQGRFAPIYISGDTVMYEAIPEIAHHFDVQTAVLHLGRVQPQADGPRFTMSADDACAAFDAVAAEWLIPVHYADWAHFSEGREAAAETFERHGLSERVRWLEPGVPTEL
jgi:L-ascorbate metabolism protein UlaG (beta-lactamase superfamily)